MVIEEKIYYYGTCLDFYHHDYYLSIYHSPLPPVHVIPSSPTEKRERKRLA